MADYRLTVSDALGRAHIEAGSLSHLALRIALCAFYPGRVHPNSSGYRGTRSSISTVEIEGPVEQTGEMPRIDHTHIHDGARTALSDLHAACETFTERYTHLSEKDVNTWAEQGLGWARDLTIMRAAVKKAKPYV